MSLFRTLRQGVAFLLHCSLISSLCETLAFPKKKKKIPLFSFSLLALLADCTEFCCIFTRRWLASGTLPSHASVYFVLPQYFSLAFYSFVGRQEILSLHSSQNIKVRLYCCKNVWNNHRWRFFVDVAVKASQTFNYSDGLRVLLLATFLESKNGFYVLFGETQKRIINPKGPPSRRILGIKSNSGFFRFVILAFS